MSSFLIAIFIILILFFIIRNRIRHLRLKIQNASKNPCDGCQTDCTFAPI